jgi:hypothetical protein
VAAPGVDVTPPTGALTSVRTPTGPVIDPSVGGALQVDGNQVVLAATATDAKYVEFIAYYDGYDEDNDGVTRDWHNFLRNNWGPGGTEAKATGATIGHIGTDSTAPYSVTWNLPAVVNQDGVRFKIRVVDAAGNVVEAPGGASADFSLQRTYDVEAYTIPSFQDQGLFFDDELPQLATDSIALPSDLGGVTRAILLGNYWNSPDISLNGNTPFPAFVGGEDTWRTSQREINPAHLRPGANTIRWNYRPPGFGSMIESPGPMIVIHRPRPAGSPVITLPPEDAHVTAGLAATFTAGATGGAPIQYQWLRDGQPIVGAVSPSYTTPALGPGDNGSKYSVRVSNSLGSVTSAEVTAWVAAPPDSNAPWWNTTWSYRAPLTVGSDAVARTDKVVEQYLNFSALMTSAGAGGPSFDPNSIRVIEVDAAGAVIDASVPFQFERGTGYSAASNAVGSLVWELSGTTPPGASRRYFVYFDKLSKSIPAVSFAPRLTRSVTTDQGFPAYRFDLEDGSDWYFHHADGGGFSSIVDRDGNDWIGWSTATGTAGNFRGYPNAAGPPVDNFHPGRAGKTVTTILAEGPLRITFQTRSSDSAWIAIWHMYPTHSEFTMTRANSLYWVLYEGVPGGTIDSGDFVHRSDGVTTPSTGTFEADLPGEEWMFAADPAVNRSFFMTHAQDDGAVESYRSLNNQMTVLGFGRGGKNLNFPYLRRLEGGQPQSFTAGLADSIDTATTPATIRAASRAPGVVVGDSEFRGTVSGPFSDSFNGVVLDPMWTEIDPLNDTTLTFTGSAVRLAVPAGASHDLWTGRSTAPRLLQAADDNDLDIVARFNSTPTLNGQGQGLLFVQDANNWIRFSLLRTATTTDLSVFRMVNGTAQRMKRTQLTGTGLGYLRVIRSGDVWRFQRSFNGSDWLGSGTFTIPFDLTQVGLVATSHRSSGSSPGFDVVVDYFENRASGVPVESGPRITNVQVDPSARGAVVTWTTNTPSSTRVDHGATVLLSNTSDDTALSVTHRAVLEFLPCNAPYFARPQSTDATGTTVGAVVSFRTDACPTVASDDFSSPTPSPFWSVVDPVGDVVVNYNGRNAIVSIPSGIKHDLFPGANLATRFRQEGPVGDFGVEAKFESVLTKRYQMQGIVVEEDANSYLRFEVHQDTLNGTGVKGYVAVVLNDVVTVPFVGNLPQAPAHYLRVTRAGTTWTLRHSVDNLSWSTLTTFNAALDSAYVGPYIGTTATGSAVSPSFVGSIDYFFNTASPLVDDGGTGADVDAPIISGVSATVGTPAGGATVSWTTNEPATSRVDWGLNTQYTGGTVTGEAAVTQHSIVIPTLTCGTNFVYRVRATDPSNNVGTAAGLALTTPPCPAGAFTDNFDGGSLDPRWIVRNPFGDGAIVPMNGLVSMAVPGGLRHDVTTTNNAALRMVQLVPNGDFQVQVGFESVVNFGFQLQGLVFEQDDSNLVRFDIFNDGSQTKVFVGRLTSSSLQTLGTVVVPGSVPGTLRATRTGTNWRFEYSPDDGVTWQLAWTGTLNAVVNRMGPFVGNSAPQAADVPEHTALVDYFRSSADPLAITRPGTSNGPAFTMFGGNGEVWNGLPIRFGTVGMAQPQINVMGRVTDPDGIRSLTYRVNGGDPIRMGIGTKDCDVGVSCTRRLAGNGDFNADIDVTDLDPGLNTVSFRAIDGSMNVGTINVPVWYTAGTAWPIPYTVDWNSTTDLNDAVQPIDGRWVVEGDTVRTKEIGYDRLLGIGDASWRSYEIEVPITVRSVDFAGYEAPSGGPAIGFIGHWQGHSQVGIVQPEYGFRERLGALAWYRWRRQPLSQRLEILDSNAVPLVQDASGKTIATGVTYIYKMQVEEASATRGPIYRLKVWQQGTSEPLNWDLVTSTPLGTATTGGALLVAHHVDASFGDVQVRRLAASPPVVTPNSGSYPSAVQVAMTSTAGSVIRYTVDGSTPGATSTQYTGPFVIDRTTVVKARAFQAGVEASAVTERSYTILPASGGRVSAGLEAEYLFDEGSGSTINDTAPGDPLNLAVQSGSSVTWVPGALRLNGSSLLRTTLGARLVNEPIRASGSMSFEMWVDPSTADTLSRTLLDIGPSGSTENNLELTQVGTALRSSLRTSLTNKAGTPFQTAPNAVPDGVHQVVYVRRPSGAVEVFVDGVSVWTSTVAGSLSNWNLGFPMGIGNNNDRNAPWLGDLHHVAIYSDDLTGTQVAQNFAAGLPGSLTLAATTTTDSAAARTAPSTTTTTTAPTTTAPTTTAPTTTAPTTTAPTTTAPTTTAPTTTVGTGDRVTDGLVALYRFDEADGSVVRDHSGGIAPFDLEIADVAATTRVPGGLRLDSPTVLTSRSGSLLAPIVASGELTAEFWVQSVDADQLDSVLAEFSSTGGAADLRVVQAARAYALSIRTGSSTESSLLSSSGDPESLTHLVFTRAADGSTRAFVNGVEVAVGVAAGNFGSWAADASLRLGSRADGTGPWRGIYYTVALYDRALRSDEVFRNFTTGEI